jgi:hypothetical protein
MIAQCNRYEVKNLSDFIVRFDFKEEFIRKYGKSAEEWRDSNNTCDITVIEMILTDFPGVYIVDYDDRVINIYEIEDEDIC